MKPVLKILEIITLVVWFIAILIHCNGGSIKLTAGILIINACLWVIVLILTAYIIGKKTKKDV